MYKKSGAVFLSLALMSSISCSKLQTAKDLQSEALKNTTESANKNLSPLTVGVISDWEWGNALQWNGIVAKSTDQWKVDSFPNIPVRQGKYAGRLMVRPGDNKPGTSGERCEPEHYHDDWNNYYQETIGDDYYYGWSNYFPTTWTNPTGWGNIFQFHHSNPINPPIAINVAFDTIAVSVLTGETVVSGENMEHREYAYRNYQRFLNTLNKGQWNDFIMHVKFRPDWTGIIEIWHKTQSQSTFTKLVTLTGIPTMQWSYNTELFQPEFEISYGTWLTSPVWFRNGLYRGSGGTNTNVLFHDNFARGTTFAEIAARF